MKLKEIDVGDKKYNRSFFCEIFRYSTVVHKTVLAPIYVHMYNYIKDFYTI